MTPDAPLVAAWSAGVFYLHRALVRDQRGAWLGVGLAMGIGLLGKYPIVLLAAGAAGFVLTDPLARRWLACPQPIWPRCWRWRCSGRCWRGTRRTTGLHLPSRAPGAPSRATSSPPICWRRTYCCCCSRPEPWPPGASPPVPHGGYRRWQTRAAGAFCCGRRCRLAFFRVQPVQLPALSLDRPGVHRPVAVSGHHAGAAGGAR